jgi:hypothetical protein
MDEGWSAVAQRPRRSAYLLTAVSLQPGQAGG